MSNHHIFDSIFDLIHYDIWGPYHVPSHDGLQYFLTLADDCSRFTWTYFLRHKYEVGNILIHFITLVKTQFGKTVKQIQSNTAKELAITQFL